MNALPHITHPVTVILVEDDDGDAKAITRAFTKARVSNHIIRVHDGIEALDLLRDTTRRPEHFVLLVDLNMPRMGGLELVAELRRDPALRKAVVFITTTSRDSRDREGAYDLNVAGYIVKNNAGLEFLDLATALDNYWRVVELPDLSIGLHGN